MSKSLYFTLVGVALIASLGLSPVLASAVADYFTVEKAKVWVDDTAPSTQNWSRMA
jgi:hypothetical protein